MRLPDLSFSLPDWKDADFRMVKEAEKAMQTIARGAGKGSDKFKDACRKLLNLVIQGQADKLPASINSSIDVRAATFLLGSSEEFLKYVVLTRALLDKLVVPRNPMSKLSLVQLIRAYFVSYDIIANNDVLADWRELIKLQLNQLNQKNGHNDLASYIKYAAVLFSSSGPSDVVAFAKSKVLDLDSALIVLGLKGFSNGRFLTLCRYQYYLDTLKTIPVGSEHDILYEIVKKDVVTAPFDTSRLLGHAILEVLIDRTAGNAISPAWQSAILTIAGDPRVPTSNQNYQQWWALLGTHRISLMRGWLSRFDLALFLKVLEQSAKDSSNSDMERMFGSRKRFMEGLLDQGIVSHSRLFLSKQAVQYLNKFYKKNQLPEFAIVNSLNTSMIYLNLSGSVHMIEGSHSFKLKLLDKLPKKSRIVDYSVREFSDSDLRSGILDSYFHECDTFVDYLDLTHDVQLGWQHKAIKYLSDKGISVSAYELIGADRYREYKYKFGVY